VSIKESLSSLKAWFEERLGVRAVMDFLRHKTVPQNRHTPWSYTGSVILLFFTIQVITGIMLALYYKPTLEEANKSVARIMTDVPLGWIVRSIHFWSATFMIATVFVHFLSVWIIKSYRKPRELTWMTGVILLILTLAFGFTGYLLPWDDLSLAATKVGTDMPSAIPVVGKAVTKLLRGGEDITGDTLSRFFTIHISILPLALLLVIGAHVYLIQKLGISLPLDADREKEKRNELPFWPNFVYREMNVWLILFGVAVTVGILLPPSLDKAANLLAPAPPGIKPEWYFLFLFQTLKLFPARIWFIQGETIAVSLIIAAVVLFFFLPLIDNKPTLAKGRIITAAAFAFIVYAVAMSVWSLLS
jgi:cytochrome b6